MRLVEKEKKKNLDMNSVHTRPVEGIPKKIAIKFKKLKKTLSGVIFSENGVR